MQRWYILFLLVCSAITHVSAQGSSKADSTIVAAALQLHTGRIIPHSSSIVDLTHAPLWGAQVDFSRLRLTQTAWSACNCYSRNGISLSYFDFNNPEELGAAYSLAVYAEPQLSHGRFTLSFRGGAGISYLTRVYHPAENPRNLFFSKPWSGLLLVQLSGRYPLTQQWAVRLAAAYHHISNGGQRQPNKGMNFPTLSLSVEHSSSYKPLARRVSSLYTDKSLRYYAGLSYNTRSVDESDFASRSREMVIGLHAGIYKPFARMHAVGTGLEFHHDNALKARARQQPEPFDHRVVSALLIHHLLFGRFDFSQAMGFYVHKQYPTPAPVFQRYVLRYRLLEKLQLGLSLKAHLDTAEQMDLRLGMLF